jgi:hypothetical protein
VSLRNVGPIIVSMGASLSSEIVSSCSRSRNALTARSRSTVTIDRIDPMAIAP